MYYGLSDEGGSLLAANYLERASRGALRLEIGELLERDNVAQATLLLTILHINHLGNHRNYKGNTAHHHKHSAPRHDARHRCAKSQHPPPYRNPM